MIEINCSSEKLIAVHDAPYVDDRFERVQMPPLISYQCDRLDLIYLEGLNEKRREMGLPPIAEKVFCEVIDRFEVDTYKVRNIPSLLFCAFFIVGVILHRSV